jgi:hypothetical protein
MKLYVSNLESHICLDDEQKTITTVTSSSILNNCAFAHTQDAGAFYGFSMMVSETMDSTYKKSPHSPSFLPDTEENFNNVKASVLSKLNNL